MSLFWGSKSKKKSESALDENPEEGSATPATDSTTPQVDGADEAIVVPHKVHSVSYTHLDVYKRQPKCRRNWCYYRINDI